MKYKYISHTADAKFKAFGKDIDEVFANSALAMFNILGKTDNVRVIKRLKIKINAKDLESLLYDFLQELIFLFETKNFMLNRVEKIKIDEKKFTLNAIVVGDDFRNYDLKSQLKSVTYSDMIIKKKKDKYESIVVVDI